MIKLIKSSLYKLFRDATFKITLIVGAALAVFMTFLYYLIDVMDSNGLDEVVHFMCTGQNLLVSSMSPSSNFGITVPVNLIVFIIGEYNCGTIRNKIIAGNKKSHIYLSLIFTGLIFTISLMTLYVGISTGLATLLGGFSGSLADVLINGFSWKIVICGLLSYVFIATFAIFVSTNIRSIGGSLPIVIMVVMIISMIHMIQGILFTDLNEANNTIIQWISPLYILGTFGNILTTLMDGGFEFSNHLLISGIVTPLYWSMIFTGLGLITFIKRDVK